ncbi:cardiolipin synthase (CMP-forming) isoform X1 [Scleropages formosus]|uniref:Cardiolipin synthase (CMP-forming) n=1 Tax=Scleropages formosus TaxID=113540 RepID=A0A8C9TVV7_SCLFO|nr:cardiolipin synthase (CMP-forming) isoform X1 [Scleropages formosus]
MLLLALCRRHWARLALGSGSARAAQQLNGARGPAALCAREWSARGHRSERRALAHSSRLGISVCARGQWTATSSSSCCHTRGRRTRANPRDGGSAAALLLLGPGFGPCLSPSPGFGVTSGSVRPGAPQGPGPSPRPRSYSNRPGRPQAQPEGEEELTPQGPGERAAAAAGGGGGGGRGSGPPKRDPPPAANQGLSHLKEQLYENPWTIPNLLCMARMGLAPVLGYLIVEQYFHLSLGLFVLAGATDLLDGYIARNWANQKSALGSALDPLADKILISVLYVSLTYASLIPAPLTALVISRDVALIAAVFYVRYKTIPPPRTLSKYFNPCYATAQLKPTLISKVNTVVQLVLAAATLAAPVFHYTDSAFLQALWLITALTTAASGYSYYHYGKKTVEVLNRTK